MSKEIRFNLEGLPRGMPPILRLFYLHIYQILELKTTDRMVVSCSTRLNQSIYRGRSQMLSTKERRRALVWASTSWALLVVWYPAEGAGAAVRNRHHQSLSPLPRTSSLLPTSASTGCPLSFSFCLNETQPLLAILVSAATASSIRLRKPRAIRRRPHPSASARWETICEAPIYNTTERVVA